MLLTGPESDGATDSHEGFVAGRYRNGALSDIWTEVTRCADGTFTAFVPVCECGWRGATHPPGPAGVEECRQEWEAGHLAQLRGSAAPAHRRIPAPAAAVAAGADRVQLAT